LLREQIGAERRGGGEKPPQSCYLQWLVGMYGKTSGPLLAERRATARHMLTTIKEERWALFAIPSTERRTGEHT